MDAADGMRSKGSDLLHGKAAADHVFQFYERNKARDGESSNRNDEMRAAGCRTRRSSRRNNFGFPADLERDRFRRRFARETAADRGEINFGAHFNFAQTAEFLEPAEQSSAGCMRERPFRDRLVDAGRLAN